MKAALIPPVGLFDLLDMKETGYHLCLYHIFETNPTYRAMYTALAQDPSQYVILDNSAHELGTGQEIEALVQGVRDLAPREIVLPDTLFNGLRTFRSTRLAVRVFRQEFPRLKLMGVPQGTTQKELLLSLESLLTLSVDVIGVSKDYEQLDGLSYLEFIEEVIKRSQTVERPVEIHLLGWTRNLLLLNDAAKRFGSALRGVDSAKPFVYAWDNVKLSTGTRAKIPLYPRRPAKYFDLTLADFPNLDAIRRNIKVFLAFAQGEGRDDL